MSMGSIGRVLFFLVFLLFHFSYAQEEPVLWSEDLVLNWSYFKDSPDQSSPAAALTASGISYEFTAEELNGELKVEYEVMAFFYPDKSWYKSAVCDDNILSHEQLHFDIAELYARKLRCKLESVPFNRNVKKQIREIYQKTIKELSDFQDVYDKETDYSRNIPNQIKWNQKIKSSLQQ